MMFIWDSLRKILSSGLLLVLTTDSLMAAKEGEGNCQWSGNLKSGLSMDWGNVRCSDINIGFATKRAELESEVLRNEYYFSGEFFFFCFAG